MIDRLLSVFSETKMLVRGFLNFKLEPVALERNFREEMLSEDKVLAKKIILLITLVVIGFIVFDFYYLPPKNFYITLSCRLFTVLTSFLFVLMIPGQTSVKSFDRDIILWAMVLVIHILIVTAVRPGDYVTIAVYDMIVILGAYIVFPISLQSQMMLSFFLTGGSIMLLVGYKNPSWQPVEIAMTITGYFVANVLGLFISGRFNRLRRNQFAQIKQEAKIKKELEAEISERKQVQTALQESEELFVQITGHTSALVSIHDENGNYIFASPSHQRLGYSPESLIGQSGFTMVEEDDIGELVDHLEQAQQGKVSNLYINYRLKSKEGRVHNFRGSFDAVFRTDGSLERIVCVGEDITELRKAQEQKEAALSSAAEAKKLALIGQVAGKMAHDFNNILGVIMGLSEISQLDCKDKIINDNLKMIFDQTLWGKNLTKNLVAFAKSQEPKQTFFLINQTTDLVIDLMRKDLENISVSVEHAPNIPHLLADQGMIQHTLMNLLQNSIHATSKKENPVITIRTYCLDKKIFFEIEDNGCGIPGDHLKKIYEPSFTLKGSADTVGAYETGIKGTGYGLANVKKYVEQNNGIIQVESVVNSGTTFTIGFPVISNELSVEEKTVIQKGVNHSEKNILLVEDEKAILDVQYRILTQAPCCHKVDTASSGQAAIDLFSKNQYDFISLDYVLHGDMNGKDIYEHIRGADKEIPILFISGNIEFLEAINYLKQQDPFVEHLTKPCTNFDYINCINKLMSKASF